MNTGWNELAKLNPEIREQFEAMSEQEQYDAFYTSLVFGTAGMRGLLGIGPNRINEYTIAKASLGYGKYLKELYPNSKVSVAIAYDNRHFSKDFAIVSANVLYSLGIESYVFEDPRPTPELSYAVKELGCQGGIVITASHNPKEYNGYKVYDETGCQLVDHKIKRVIELIDEEPDETKQNIHKDIDIIHWLGQEMDDSYKEALQSVSLLDEPKRIKIVLSTQHGTANPVLPDKLKEMGYDVYIVESQASYDPNFTNTITPNPEDKRSFEKAIQLAKEIDADLVLSTDPDADRMGIVVKHHGDYVYFTGNQGGAVLQEYLYSTLQKQTALPTHPVMFNTVVTSNLGDKIAEKYGVEVIKTLTGFKYIGDKIDYYNTNKEKDFVFGYEESYGYLVKDLARDKDALQACVLVAESCNHYLLQDKTLVDVLHELYEEHGTFYETQIAITLAGDKGLQEIQDILARFRNNKIEYIGGFKVDRKTDFMEVNEEFPLSNVLKYELEDGSWVAIRPSGTEPKCKFYYCIQGDTMDECILKFENLKKSIHEIAQIGA